MRTGLVRCAYIGPPAPNAAGGVPTSGAVVTVTSGVLLLALTSLRTPSTAASSRDVSGGVWLLGVSAADMAICVRWCGGGGKKERRGESGDG